MQSAINNDLNLIYLYNLQWLIQIFDIKTYENIICKSFEYFFAFLVQNDSPGR